MIAKSYSKMPIQGGDLKSGWKRLTTGQKGYTTSSQQIVDKFGGKTIASIMVCRSPVSLGFIVKTFDLIKDKPYNDLFHLYMVVTFTTGKQIVCEKNEVINISKIIPPTTKKTEKIPVSVPSGLTLNTMLNNAMKSMGENTYFTYNAIKNNCQNYLLALITSSNMANPNAAAFIKRKGYIWENRTEWRECSNQFGGDIQHFHQLN